MQKKSHNGLDNCGRGIICGMEKAVRFSHERNGKNFVAKIKMFFAALLLAGLPSLAGGVRGPEAWLEFMGGNVRMDGLRLDLQAIKDAGISGVQFFHINRGGAWPECPEQIPCMSEKWEDVVRFLGDECARLGLVLTVQNCPGWSQSGGPWIDLDHCQRDIACARLDFDGGGFIETALPQGADGVWVGCGFKMPEIPAKFRDADSDWRDVCVLAFPTPEGDAPDAFLKPKKVEKDGETRIFRFDRPVTVRSLVLPGVDCWNHSYAYEMPWMRVALDVETPQGWQEVVRSPLPTTSWRDYVETFTLACGETKGSTWRFRFEHDLPIKKYCEPKLSSAPRMTDWEGKSARTLRSLLRDPPPKQGSACFIDPSRIVDMTDYFKDAGGSRSCATADARERAQQCRVPPGRWTVIRLGHVNAKRVNAPAPKEATGWECDKLDPSGIEANFKGYIGKLNDGVLKGKMRAMLVDSWECFGQTWTPKMEEYFRRANGYALRQWLPALFGWIVESPESTERFLTDWRRTNGDLITKNYYGRMAELAHEAGLEAYYETAFGDIIHGDLLEYWKYSDAPMCEYWYPHRDRIAGGCCWYTFKPIRPCASAAHIYGKQRVVAEAFTGSGIQWDEDFKKLQDDANRHFARGVTHLAFQSYTHAPAPDAKPPGGCMGGFNGTPFTRLQTWWKDMPEFTAWLTRCEEFLEAGLPAQDVLWYLGDAVDHKPDEEYPFPEGFRADYLNHDVLTNRLTVKDGVFTVMDAVGSRVPRDRGRAGRASLPGPTWKMLWVPDERFMLPATRKRLGELAAAGGKVVFGGKDALVKALAGCEKDVATEPSLGDGSSEDFMWIHRKVEGGDRYFVAAGTNGWRGKVTFRAKGDVSVFDPVSCERTAWRNGDVLDIPPSRSVFVVFGGDDKTGLTGFSGLGESHNPVNPVKKEIELTGWTLSFPAGWGAPEKVTLDRPVSWTEIPGFTREAQAFSGTVTYETEFDCMDVNSPFTLDLGRVESMAKVFVNGQPVRTLWCEPFRCDISKFVSRGRNRLRIDVTNTWRNRVIYDLGQPEQERKTWILYQPRYNPKSTDPFVPSGILGPIYLKGY